MGDWHVTCSRFGTRPAADPRGRTVPSPGSSMSRVRPLRESDIPSIARLHRTAFSHDHGSAALSGPEMRCALGSGELFLTPPGEPELPLPLSFVQNGEPGQGAIRVIDGPPKDVLDVPQNPAGRDPIQAADVVAESEVGIRPIVHDDELQIPGPRLHLQLDGGDAKAVQARGARWRALQAEE